MDRPLTWEEINDMREQLIGRDVLEVHNSVGLACCEPISSVVITNKDIDIERLRTAESDISGGPWRMSDPAPISISKTDGAFLLKSDGEILLSLSGVSMFFRILKVGDNIPKPAP